MIQQRYLFLVMVVLLAGLCLGQRYFRKQPSSQFEPDLSGYRGDVRFYRTPADRPHAEQIPYFPLAEYPLLYHDDTIMIRVFRYSDGALLFQRPTKEVYPEIERWKKEAGL